jgi:F-type H+-transporting ATPase subunit gamma
MPNLRDIKKRIRAVISTKQITKAMEMVAAARLRKAQQMVEQSRPYSEKMRLILEQISAASTEIEHPFFQQREVRNRILVVFTSDRGLCGSYNTNVVRYALRLLKEEGNQNIKLVLVGKKGDDVFRRQNWPILKVYKGLQGRMNLDVVHDLTNFLIDQFLSGQADEIQLLYTKFLSMVSYKVGVVSFLPIQPPKAENASNKHYIFEPDPRAIFNTLMPAYALTIVQMAIADSLASEHGTRMIAMGMATKNASEMTDTLTLQYNKARQATITKELLEVVSGANALKG